MHALSILNYGYYFHFCFKVRNFPLISRGFVIHRSRTKRFSVAVYTRAHLLKRRKPATRKEKQNEKDGCDTYTYIYKRAKGRLKYEAEWRQADVTRAHVTLFLYAAMRASRVFADSAISVIFFPFRPVPARAEPNSLSYVKKSYYTALILFLSSG